MKNVRNLPLPESFAEQYNINELANALRQALLRFLFNSWFSILHPPQRKLSRFGVMDIFGDYSLAVTRWLQENYPQLESFFYAVTQTGGSEFYMMVITLVYWCIDKRLGRALGYLLSFSYVLNAITKHLIRNQRPFWEDLLLALVDESSYGVPSGHAQAATIFYGLLAAFINRAWAWLLAIILILLMALSRIYLGVHDIEDVLAGIFLGVIVLIGYALWNRYLAARFNNRILGQRLLIAITVPIVLAVVYAIGLFLIDPPTRSPAFDPLVEAAEQQSWEDSSAAFGLLLGLSIGYVMEISRVRFISGGPLGRRVLRYVLGIGVTLALYIGIETLTPEEPLGLLIPLRALGHMFLALWIAYYAPWVFVRLKLADARSEPEVTLTV